MEIFKKLDLLSVHGKIEVDNDNYGTSRKQGNQEKGILDKKGKYSLDIESMSRIIKRLANDMVDLKKMDSKNSH